MQYLLMLPVNGLLAPSSSEVSITWNETYHPYVHFLRIGKYIQNWSGVWAIM